ncbi:MAG: hypothetical protein JWP29_1934 [Rhodoferax sp.]|nr:hypothetical protein [Rhodoferax sp.]
MTPKRGAITAARLRAWNDGLARERAKALAEAIIVAAPDTGADGPAATARLVRTEEVEGRSKGTASRGERVTARRVVCECTIDTLHAQNHLTRTQWGSGIWFRQRYLTGYKGFNGTASYGERVPGAATMDEAVRVTAARKDLAIVAAMVGQLEWAALERCAGHDQNVGAGNMRFLVAALDTITVWRNVGRPVK